MKKRTTAVLACVMAAAFVMTGCQGSTGLETEELVITQYKGVEIVEVEKPAEITEEDVDATIQTMLSTYAEEEEVTDRPVEDGDIATIDFLGKIDGEAFDGGEAADYPLEIGSDSFIDGFEDSIIGHSIGDTFDWNGSFPDDYAAVDYAGKDVAFTITVKSITSYKVPELNDEFVQKVSDESKTVDEYREEIKKELEEDAEFAYKDTISSYVWETVLANTTVNKYPEEEIKELCDNLLSQYEFAAEYSNMEYAEFIQSQMGVDVATFEAQVEDAAKENIKQTMVTNAIAEKEGLKVGSNEYNKKLQELADMYGYESVEALQESVEAEQIENIVLNGMVLDWLVEHCVQVAK